MRRFASVVVVALVLVAASLWWFDSRQGAGAVLRTDEALLVETILVERAAGYDTRESHAGRVVSRRTSALGFDAPGRVVEVLAQEGDAVDAGQELARRLIQAHDVHRHLRRSFMTPRKRQGRGGLEERF